MNEMKIIKNASEVSPVTGTPDDEALELISRFARKTPDAMTYYITAVLGARTDNASLLYDGLRKAIQLDPSMAAKAMDDLEFSKYVASDAFQSIIK